MNRYIISILKDGVFWDSYISADDERDEHQFRSDAEKLYPQSEGYKFTFINRPHIDNDTFNKVYDEKVESDVHDLRKDV